MKHKHIFAAQDHHPNTSFTFVPTSLYFVLRIQASTQAFTQAPFISAQTSRLPTYIPQPVMAVIRSPTVMSFLQQIRSPKTRYFELPTGEHGQRSSEPRSSWRKPIFLGFLAIFCILGIWSLSRTGLPSRISGQGLAGENKSESQESETSSNNTKGLVIASYTAQNVSWLSAIPSE